MNLRKPTGLGASTPSSLQLMVQRLVEIVNGLQGAREVEERAVRFEDLYQLQILQRQADGVPGKYPATNMLLTPVYTVAALPTPSSALTNVRAFVSDSNATTFAAVVAGGGANGVPVYCDGTNWRIG